jgi:hypothetical protein
MQKGILKSLQTFLVTQMHKIDGLLNQNDIDLILIYSINNYQILSSEALYCRRTCDKQLLFLGYSICSKAAPVYNSDGINCNHEKIICLDQISISTVEKSAFESKNVV